MGTRRRLTNDDWGLESNCFVCEAGNDRGLRLAFWADDDRQRVECDLQLGPAHSGAPAVVHGGLSLAVLDEAQAWAVIAFGGQFGVTIETRSTFHLPVWVDHPHRLEGEVVGHDGEHVLTEGRIVDGNGGLCVSASARFLPIGEATSAALAADADRGPMRKFVHGGLPEDGAEGTADEE